MKKNYQKDAGFLAVELLIWVPVILFALSILLYFGKVALASTRSESAAFEAARAASLEKDPYSGFAAAKKTIDGSMAGVCGGGYEFASNTWGLATKVGVNAAVDIYVACKVTSGGASFGLGNVTVGGYGRVGVDPYKERG